MINTAILYAQKTGKPMQVVYSEHGGYQVFPAKFGVSQGYEQVYTTEGEDMNG